MLFSSWSCIFIIRFSLRSGFNRRETVGIICVLFKNLYNVLFAEGLRLCHR